jgi:MFS family permease
LVVSRQHAGVDTLDEVRPVGWHRLLVEPRRPEAIRRRPNAFWLAVAAVCIGATMGQLDASIVTVALPTLQDTFHVSVGAVAWVGLSYLLVLVATVAAVGRFADMWGHKLLYVYGFGIFIVGSALCGLAPNPVVRRGFD